MHPPAPQRLARAGWLLALLRREADRQHPAVEPEPEPGLAIEGGSRSREGTGRRQSDPGEHDHGEQPAPTHPVSVPTAAPWKEYAAPHRTPRCGRYEALTSHPSDGDADARRRRANPMELLAASPVVDAFGEVARQVLYAGLALLALSVAALIALAVPSDPKDVDVFTAGAGFIGGFLIAGSVLTQLAQQLFRIRWGLSITIVYLLIFTRSPSGEAVAVIAAVALICVVSLLLAARASAVAGRRLRTPGPDRATPKPSSAAPVWLAYLGVLVLAYGFFVQLWDRMVS
jgi:hypothetical protein